MLIGYVSDERYVALPDVQLEFERDGLTGPSIPDLGGSVVGSRDNEPAVRAELDVHHVLLVTTQHEELLIGLGVPDAHGSARVE